VLKYYQVLHKKLPLKRNSNLTFSLTLFPMNIQQKDQHWLLQNGERSHKHDQRNWKLAC